MRKCPALIALIIFLLLSAATVAGSSPRPAMPPAGMLAEGLCSYVVDGDTAWFEVMEASVYVAHSYRFIGVNTPETVHPEKAPEPYGPEASAFTAETLLGRRVYIEYDTERIDDYGRHLCYVWLEDGTLFNLTLLELGYGKLSLFPPNMKYADYLAAAQKAARQAQAGLWAPPESAASAIDLSSMTDEELRALQTRITEELRRRSGED